MKEKTGVIYRIWNRVNAKSYIGKTIYPKERIQKHFSGSSACPALHNAIKKYGKDAFVVEILEEDVPEHLLAKFECLHIRFWNAKVPNGYNLTDGGEGMSGWKASQETRRKISEAQKGKSLSPEHRRKLSEAKKGTPSHNKGKTLSPEHRRKISEANQNRSPEHRQKLSKSLKGRTVWNKGKTDIYSDATLKQMSNKAKGRTAWNKGKTGINSGEKHPMYGKKHTPESIAKMSDKKKGTTPWNKGKTGVYSDEHRRKISESLKRRHRSS